MTQRVLFTAFLTLSLVGAGRAADPGIVAHRGLLREGPENTLAAYGVCLDLRLGFELDVRRSKDGHLVVVHDDTVDRTTDGKGKVAELTLEALKKLDAGRWFDPAFAGQRIPTVDEVFALVKDRGVTGVFIAVDMKIDDETLATDVVKLANKHGVLGQMVFIGRTIEDAAVRRKLKAADAKAPTAVLAQKPVDLAEAMKDRDADWVYTRFMPTPDEVQQVHEAGKKVFLSGPPVNRENPGQWRRARAIGADALLTDHPLDCRRSWREGRSP